MLVSSCLRFTTRRTCPRESARTAATEVFKQQYGEWMSGYLSYRPEGKLTKYHPRQMMSNAVVFQAQLVPSELRVNLRNTP